jgi:hypothetical protein
MGLVSVGKHVLPGCMTMAVSVAKMGETVAVGAIVGWSVEVDITVWV